MTQKQKDEITAEEQTARKDLTEAALICASKVCLFVFKELNLKNHMTGKFIDEDTGIGYKLKFERDDSVPKDYPITKNDGKKEDFEEKN